MDNTIGRWYLNGTTLEYREFKKDSTTGSYTEELSTTALVKISGLSTSQVVNGTGNDAGVVLVKDESLEGDSTWRKLTDSDIVFGDETKSDNKTTGTITIASLVLPKQANKSISITGSTNYEYTLKLAATDQVRLKGTDTVSHGTNGTTTIVGTLTEGYTIATNGKSATYYAERTNQKLATITGLAKSYTESTLRLNDVAYEANEVGGTGEITLSKTSTAGEVSALGTSAITLSMDNVATANGISYHLKLNESSGTYKQVAANDEKAYWTVKGTTATYQYYSPTGYELTNAKNEVISTDGKLYKSDGVTEYASGEGDRVATKVKVTAAKTTTVVTVTGLAADLTTNITDNNQYPKAVGTGQARITDNFVSGITVEEDVDTDGDGSKPTYKADGKTLDTEATNEGKGTAKIQISKAALPTSGTVTITPGKEFTVTAEPDDDFYQKSDDTVPTDVQKQRIWVINGTTATYKEVDLAYYTVGEPDDKGVQKIVCTTQTSGTVLATVKNLNEDWLANEANLTRIDDDTNGGITAIKGITITTQTNGYTYTNDKPVANTENPGEILLSSEVLDGKNVTIANSDNYRLALDTSDDHKVDLPGFSNYKWNLSGTTATLKGDVTAGYTAADNGKTITYTAAATNQTLATVNGLKKGTELERDTTGDAKETDSNYRKIGNYIGTDFVEGLAIEEDSSKDDGKLSHNESGTLVRMPITISKHVMDTSKISLNSNFFTLKLDTTDQGNEVGNTLADKAASRTYVLTKDEVYTKGTDDKGKTTYTPNTDADAIIGWHGTLGSTAKLQTSVPACYELATDGKSITYTKPANGVLLATVKGLNSAVTENDIKVGINPDTDGKYTITIKNSNALTTGNVTITNATTDENKQYKLALETGGTGDTAISGFDTVLTDKSWSQSGTTINYTAKVSGPGYKLSSDASQITYLKENTSSTPTTLATITGLRKEILTSASETAPTGIALDTTTGTITLSNTVLNNTNVELKGNANYTLKVDTEGDDAVVTTKPPEIERWVISGTTATYKAVVPDYYTQSGNKLTYTAVKDAVYQDTDKNNEVTYANKTLDENKNKYNANGTGKTIPALVAIKGLKSGLAVDSTGKKIGYYNGSGTFVEAIAFDTDDKTLIISDAGVLDYKSNVELDKTASDAGYKIKLADSLDLKPTLATGSTAAWTISNGTATYKGNVAAGYANNADNTKIIFSKAQNNAEIAKITGLKKGITDASSIKENSGTITITNAVLGETDAKLETKIALTGSDYKLALDSGVKQEVKSTDEKNIWSVSGTTATYGIWTPTYYTLEDNDDDAETTLNNVIKYHGEGVSDDKKLATITGLVSGLVTIPDTAQDNLGNAVIRGITVSGTTITLDSNVLSESPKTGDFVTLTRNSDIEYELAVTSNVDTPQNTVAYTITNGTNAAEVKINQEMTAGFTLDNSAKTGDVTTPTLTYTATTSAGDGLIANLTGLKKGITLNAEGGIDGIEVDGTNSENESEKTITLSTAVLTNSSVANTHTTSKYTLKLANGITESSRGWGWVATGTKGTYELCEGMATSGYSEKDKLNIEYTGGDQDGTAVATVSGLDNATLTGTALSGITLGDNGNIIIGEAALSKKDIVITAAEGKTAPTIELAAGINESKTTKTWSVNNGTATHTQTISEGYEVVQEKDDNDNVISTYIKYTPEGTITSTLTGLSKENLHAGTVDSDGNNILYTTNADTPAIAFNETDRTFIVNDANALAHKKATLTVKTSNNLKATDYPYTFALASDVAAKVDDPVWNKEAKDTKATYTQTTASGYSLDSKATSINYSTDPTTVTLATISGLKSGDGTAAVSGALTGLEIKTKTEDGETVNATDNDGNTIITISKNLLTTTNVSLGGSDKYVFELDATTDGDNPSDTAVPAAATNAQVWTVSGTTATYKNVQTPYYKLGKTTENSIAGTTTGKSIEYVKQADGTVEDATIINRTVIKGLKSGLKPDDDGKIDGIEVADNISNPKVTLSAKVLGTSTVTSDEYILAPDTTDVVDESKATNKIEWVGDGTTYTYKKYNKPYYTLTATGTNASKEITYTKAKDVEVYAKITGLAKDLVDNSATATESSTSTAIGFSGTSTEGGIITLGKKQLEGVTSTVKLDTTGKFKLALDTTSADNATTKAEITGRKWATSGTTATLTATKGVGYTLSEDEKSITYQKTEGTVTLAKITGLKKGATITEDLQDSSNSDVALDSTTGNYVITLKQAQLGTTDVKVTGDGYTLKIAADALSGSTDPDWVKADNQTKATFTQTRYNGFRESTDGKSLIYQKATGTVDLATINGLSKTLKKDQMAVVTNSTNANDYANALVVLNTDTKVITLKQAALSGKVTLGKNDDYTLKLQGAENGKIGGTEVTKKVTYNNGTMSIVSGTTESWEESTDGKTLNYTAAKYDTLATVSNLPKNLTYTDGGTTATLAGVTVDGDDIKIGKNAVNGLANNAKITLSNKKVDNTTSTYKLVNATGADSLSALPSAPDKKKWVLSGTTLDLKAVTSEGFSVSDTVIAYTAEKVGNSLAKITFKGLTKDFITQKSDGTAIYVGGTTTSAVSNALKNMDSKEITLDANLLNSIKGADLATTIELTGSNGYTFATTNFTGNGAQQPPETQSIKFNEDSFKTAGKATLKQPTSAGWTFDLTNKNKAVYSKATSADGGTVNGINKSLTYSQVSDSGSTTLKLGTTSADSLKITVGAAALTTTDVTFTTVRGGNSYTFVLGSDVHSTANDSTKGTWKNQIEWVSSNGTATYKFYDKENYYINDKNVIKYVKPTNGTTFAQISGMSKTASISPSAAGVISLGADDLGTSKVTLKITTAKEVNATVADATTINASITAGNTTASGFKLALKDGVLKSEDQQAVWDTNNTTANLTGTTTKGYKLSNDQMSITYQSAPTKLKVIAKVTGIKSGSKITDDNVSTNTTNPNLTIKEITLHNSNLGTSNVQLTGEGYKLKLDNTTADSVIGANGDADSIFWQDQTEWVANNGTFTYKTYDKAHYTLDSTGMKVTYTAAKDNNKDENHKTFAQITGLAKTAEASDFGALTSVSSGGSIVTANDGVISLSADVLNKANIKLTDKEIGGYSLVFGSDAASLQSTVDDKSVNAVISGTKATWTGTQGKGYFLANDGQSVTYYSSAKKKQTIATVTGLASTVTSANNDAFSDKYGGSSNVVSLSAADLSDKVTVGGTAAFEFASGVESISAVGSSSADKLTFASGNNTINAGSGNDFVTLAGGSNTFLYANGNGNDVIKGFKAESDIIKVTNVVGTTTSTKKVNNVNTTTYKNNIEVYQDTNIAADTLVRVNNNYIRLKGVTAGNVKVYDKNGDTWNTGNDYKHDDNTKNGSFIKTESSNVLADDNYAMTPQNTSADSDYAMSPNLSSIVKSSTASYTADDLVADDATALTKQSTAVSYSGKK